MSRPALVFIGFMGAGKSTALAAAREAGMQTADADELLEAELGMPIHEFFAERGEPEFRRREEELVVRLLREAEGGAVALGGGAILSAEVRAELGRHTVVWLQVSAEEAWRRVTGKGERPLAQERESFGRLLAERTPLYESLAGATVMQGDEGAVARALPSLRALPELPPRTRLLWATSASGEYPVFVGPGLLATDWWPLEGRRFCVTDSAVGALYAVGVEPLEARVEVDPGEGAKTMSSAEYVLRELARAGMTREDHVVALGGGVVGDLAGFCAHTYQRGVPVVQVPTTLVAQVDAAYGGKTGVDLPEAKNYAGAYHLPAAVIADTGTLGSLSREEAAAGFVEALKTGLLAGGDLWERVRAAESFEPDDVEDIVFECARYKCEVVAADERDGGRRQVLNLGHTTGHAIEAASDYARYRHGEAVGLGLIAALRLSGAEPLAAEVEAVLERHGLPTRLDRAVDVDDVLAAVHRDKKRTSAGVGFVLLPEPGRPRTGQPVAMDDVRSVVEGLRG